MKAILFFGVRALPLLLIAGAASARGGHGGGFWGSGFHGGFWGSRPYAFRGYYGPYYGCYGGYGHST
jgi:hypothetical protein